MTANDAIWNTATISREISWRPLKRNTRYSLAIDTNPATAFQILLLLEYVVTPNTIAANATAEIQIAIISRYPALDQAE